MKPIHHRLLYILAGTLLQASLPLSLEANPSERGPSQKITISPGPLFKGQADLSALIFLDRDTVATASDEDNILRLYTLQEGQNTVTPSSSVNLDPHILPHKPGREMDMEGCARQGDLLYWIGSHGTSRKGKARPTRRRLVATRIGHMGETWILSPTGRPCTSLVEALSMSPHLRDHSFAVAARTRVKTPGSLNIEALASTPGGELLMGLRSPLSGQRALLVPLTNPGAVIQGAPPLLGPAIRLDLGGRGLRAMEYLPHRREYIIVAGPPGSGGTFGLYRWSRDQDQAPELLIELGEGNNPETIAPRPGSEDRRLLMVHDDGNLIVQGQRNKDRPRDVQTSRSHWILLPEGKSGRQGKVEPGAPSSPRAPERNTP